MGVATHNAPQSQQDTFSTSSQTHFENTALPKHGKMCYLNEMCNQYCNFKARPWIQQILLMVGTLVWQRSCRNHSSGCPLATRQPPRAGLEDSWVLWRSPHPHRPEAVAPCSTGYVPSSIKLFNPTAAYSQKVTGAVGSISVQLWSWFEHVRAWLSRQHSEQRHLKSQTSHHLKDGLN